MTAVKSQVNGKLAVNLGKLMSQVLATELSEGVINTFTHTSETSSKKVDAVQTKLLSVF